MWVASDVAPLGDVMKGKGKYWCVAGQSFGGMRAEVLTLHAPPVSVGSESGPGGEVARPAQVQGELELGPGSGAAR